tara:strand:+ start:4432 stop:4611 length:180 start_codon:yes stop_codon:yes gene_type:complete
MSTASKALDNLLANWLVDEAKDYEMQYEVDPATLTLNELQEHNYKDLRILIRYFIQEIK